MDGQLIEGKYRVSRLIGEGGMGAVYEAEHTLIGRPVAMKILHGDYAKSPEALERFRREARAATAIRHPNIIEVTDMGTTAEGQPFLVMELLEGTPLSALFGGGRTTPTARVVDILSQVLDALEAAHRKGIVHRDLKPDNVFIVQDHGRPDFVKLLDFGISKMSTATAGGGLSVTRTGSVMGTPNYMAPEQAMGRKDCDHRVDLWAVGVMLFEALTGRLPYLGDNYNELLTAILMTTSPPPRSVNPAIAPAMERVIVRALAKEREQRYQSASELRDELRAAVEAHGTAASPAATAARPGGSFASPEVPAPAPVVRVVSAFSTETPTVPIAAPPPPFVRPATLTPGGYPSLARNSIAGRKRTWALYLGAGAVAVAGIVVAVLLSTSQGAPPPAASEVSPPGASTAAPALSNDAGSPPSASSATPDVGPARLPDVLAVGPDAGAARVPEVRALVEASAPDVARPDTGLPAAAADTAMLRDSGVEARSAPAAALPAADHGRPPRDSGPRTRDGGPPPAADDGGRPPLRRDYT